MKDALRNIKRGLLAQKYARVDAFVFIHINKTGGSSVEKALRIPIEHKTALEKIDEIGRDTWDRKLTFTIVRNPWDKVVSHYFFGVQTNRIDSGAGQVDFNAWVRREFQDNAHLNRERRMFMPQTAWIMDDDEHILVDEILRFERLERDFQALLCQLGRDAALPHIKRSDRGDYRQYYDDEAIEIVRRSFASDIELFDYHF